MGISALEDGLFVNFLFCDYLYVGGRIAGCGGVNRAFVKSLIVDFCLLPSSINCFRNYFV